MNFERLKYLYLFLVIAITTFLFVIRGPAYEVYTDISVSPPEKVRRTDFSWITVNEWFNSQCYIITSHAILRDVASDLSENKLKGIVSAKRLGAADIIRITASSGDKPEKLLELVSSVADLYLGSLRHGLGKVIRNIGGK